MAALSVEVEFGGDFGVFQGQEIDGCVFYVNGVVFGLDDEGGRGLLGGKDIGIGGEVLLGEGKVAGIDDYGEVWATAELVGGIDGIVEALIEVSAEGGGEMGSGGEAQNADAMRVDVPLRSVFADYADGALGVLEGGRGLGIGTGVRDAVFEENAGDAGGGEPVADFGAFEIDGEDVIGASRKDDNGGTGIFSCGRVKREGWRRDVA